MTAPLGQLLSGADMADPARVCAVCCVLAEPASMHLAPAPGPVVVDGAARCNTPRCVSSLHHTLPCT